MKHFMFSFLVVCCVCSFAQQESYDRISIPQPNDFQLQQLANAGIDLTCGATFTSNELILELSTFEQSSLDRLGISYSVMVEDLSTYYSDRALQDLPKAKQELRQLKAQSLNLQNRSVSNINTTNVGVWDACDEINWAVPQNFNLGSMGGCLTYSELLAELDAMRAQYPNLISAKAPASSTQTVQGRDVFYVRISDNPDVDEAEPETLYTGLTHAREAMSLMNMVYFMWYVLENYDSDPAVKDLVDHHEMYFIPVVNPDGFVYNENTNPNGGGLHRKNRSGGCSSNRGVDLNRNFGYYWNNGGSSSNSCSDTYRGNAPFSERESQIVRDFFLQHDFELTMNHHSFKNALLHAYAGNGVLSSGREDEYYAYSHDMSRYNRYMYGSSPNVSYLNSGNANDWMLGGSQPDNTGSTGSGKETLAWTPENGSSDEGGFWPAPSSMTGIAQRAMRMNFMAAYFSGKYGKLHDLTQSDLPGTSGIITLGVEHLGQTPANYTISVTPVSANITSIDAPIGLSGQAPLEQVNLGFNFTLDPSVQANEEVIYNISLHNGDYELYNADIKKYYSPTVLFSDNPDVDGLSNWSGSGWTTTSDTYSGSAAITESSSGSYSNNSFKALQLNQVLDLSSANATTIQYYAKWDLERDFDFVQLQGSTNGSNWVDLCGRYTKRGSDPSNNDYSQKGSSDESHQPSGAFLYDGNTLDKWVMEEVNISTSENAVFNGASSFYLRFVFDSDSSNRQDGYPSVTFDGFSFDDFKVIIEPLTDQPQTISFDPIPDQTTVSPPFQLMATASSGLPVSYTVLSGPATITGNTVTLTGGIGPVTIEANQSGNAFYLPAPAVAQTFVVNTAECTQVPTGITVSNITSSSAEVSWDPLADADFEVRFRAVGTTNWSSSQSPTNSNSLTGLASDTEYEAQVQSLCPDGSASGFTASIFFTTEEEILGCGSGINAYPYSESFESGLGGWIQNNNDNLDWTIDSNGTPSSNTGPSNASDGSNYLYVEASGNGVGYPFKQAIITSPCFELTGLTEAAFVFDYHMYGSSDMGSLALEISTDDGQTWAVLWENASNLGNSWQSETVDLSAYVGSNINLRFNRITGGIWRADVAIDALMLLDELPEVGSCLPDITPEQVFESFESGFGPWYQETSDDLDWIRDAFGTPSNGTGPASADDGTVYIYVEASGNGVGYPTKQAILNSPCYDLTNATGATFSFAYHMYGSSDMGSLALQSSVDDGASWQTLVSFSGNQGDFWRYETVDLSNFLGSNVRLRFNRITGSTWRADIALDSFSIQATSNERVVESPRIEVVNIEDKAGLDVVTLYPNPIVADEVYLSHPVEGSFELYSMQGRVLGQGKLNGDTVVPLPALASGTYFILVRSGTSSKRFTVIKP